MKRVGLSLLVFAAMACAPAAGKGMVPVKDPKDPVPPSEEPAEGWASVNAQLSAMTREAEAIIDRARAGSGDPLARYRRAEMEIHFAMRDELGPANAALFGARSKKLQELAGAVGVTSAPAPLAFAVDSFVRETRSFAEQLRAVGYAVDESPVQAGRLLWAPQDAVGWELVVRDATRTVEEHVPYSGTAHGPARPATPAKVNPSVHLYSFPHVRLHASQSMVRREQPGEPIAAGAATVLFRLQDAQSHDQDPGGEIGKKVASTLFRESSRKEVPAAAKALGGGTAVLERGLLSVSGRGDAPAEVPELGLPEARIVLWNAQQGADIDRTLLPLR